MSSGLKAKHQYQMFVFGGVASCVGETLTCPIEVIKTRLQIQGQTGVKQYHHSVNAIVKITKKEGWKALFKGLQPSLLRQATYGTLRFGCYSVFRNLLCKSGKVEFWQRFVSGVCAGAVSSAICNPTDLIKIRMMSNQNVISHLHQSNYQYNGLLHAIKTIVKEEGFLGMYKGSGPTSFRGAIVAGAEIASYDEIKALLIQYEWCKEGVASHLLASIAAGFLGVAFSNPVDVIKSRYMNQPLDDNGRGMLYKNSLDCFVKTVRGEGFKALYKGFVPSLVRNAPHCVVTYMCLEQLIRIAEMV